MKKFFKNLICGSLLSLSAVLCSNYFAEPYTLPDNINNIYMRLFNNRSAYSSLGEELYNSLNKLPNDKEKLCAFFWILNEQTKTEVKVEEDISSFTDKILQDYDVVAFDFYEGTYYHPDCSRTCYDYMGREKASPTTDIISVFLRNKRTEKVGFCEIRRPIVYTYEYPFNQKVRKLNRFFESKLNQKCHIE